jgi:hypothetical protein
VDYFLVQDAARFEQTVRPALAEAWRLRRFEPCRDLCRQLLPAAQEYADRHHTGALDDLLRQVIDGLPFDRAGWRLLVGEVLLFTALEIPEFQDISETLCCLLAPAHFRAGSMTMAREQLAPIQQVYRGSHDLTFGRAVYRPEYAGLSGVADVARLGDYLDSVRPEAWTPADLEARADLAEDDRAEELAFAQEWFPVLRDFYRRVRQGGHLLVIETVY